MEVITLLNFHGRTNPMLSCEDEIKDKKKQKRKKKKKKVV